MSLTPPRHRGRANTRSVVVSGTPIAVPSELGEDDILLIVTLRPGATLDYAELLDFCAARMPYCNCTTPAQNLTLTSLRGS